MNTNSKMRIYKLVELLDKSIGSPEVGAVNFNALHLVLKTIIEETDIVECTVEWQEPELSSLVRKVFGKKDSYDNDIFDELKSKLLEMDASDSESDSSANSKARRKYDYDELSSRMRLFEEEFEKMVKKLDDFQEETATLGRRRKYDEGYKRERRSEFGMSQEELEDTIDDLGEAISRVAIKLKEQKYLLDEVSNEEKLHQLCQKLVDDRMDEREKTFKFQLQNLASAVRNLQLLVKDFLYPEAPGVTSNCMTCGREAHLPDLEVLRSTDNEDLSRKINVPPPKKPYLGTRMKTNERKPQLKFTMISRDRLKKGNELTFQDQIKKQAGNILCDDLGESFTLKHNEELKAPFCHTDDATATFLPLRFISDPNRRRILPHK